MRDLHISHLTDLDRNRRCPPPPAAEWASFGEYQRAILLRPQHHLRGFELSACRADRDRFPLAARLVRHCALAPALPTTLAPPTAKVFRLRQPMTAAGVVENIVRLRRGKGRRSDQSDQKAGEDRSQTGVMGGEGTIHPARVAGSPMGIKCSLASLNAALEGVVPGTDGEDGPAVLNLHQLNPSCLSCGLAVLGDAVRARSWHMNRCGRVGRDGYLPTEHARLLLPLTCDQPVGRAV